MERFKKDSLKEALQENRNQDVFGEYVQELRLTAEDLKKHILDVGAGTGEFAAEAKRRGYGGITSIDIDHPADIYEMDSSEELAGGRLAVADAKMLPFKDGEFDITVSLYSMPHVLKNHNDNKRTFKKRTEHVLSEMLRVTKVGGEVRLGGVPFKEPKHATLHRGDVIDAVLKRLAAKGISVEQDVREAEDTGGEYRIGYILLKK